MRFHPPPRLATSPRQARTERHYRGPLRANPPQGAGSIPSSASMTRRMTLAGPRPITLQLGRSDRFLSGLADYKRVVFVSHIHPDPDSLGSMFGLSHLVESKLRKPCVIT